MRIGKFSRELWESMKRILFVILVVAVLTNTYISMQLLRRQIDEIQQYRVLAHNLEYYQKSITPNYDLMVKANVKIINTDRNVDGSGVCITYKGRKYILTAFHLNKTTEMWVYDSEKYTKLKLLLWNKTIDLALFEPVKELKTVKYIKFIENEVKVGDKIWVCGNPMGLTDIVASGNVVKKSKYSRTRYLIDASSYYGNSGGGVFNEKTELVGIYSMVFYNISHGLPIIYGVIIDVDVIEEFLGQLIN